MQNGVDVAGILLVLKAFELDPGQIYFVFIFFSALLSLLADRATCVHFIASV